MLKAVFFDLDGTLYDRDGLVDVLLASQYDAFASELCGITREQFLRDARAMDDHGYGIKETGYCNLVRLWGGQDSLAQRLIGHFWEHYDEHCRLTHDVRTTLDELRKRGLKLGVITNGAGLRQRRKISALGLDDTFDTILVSAEEGVRKPDAEIFRRGLERCAVAASESVFVGDHPVADVQGAHRAGLFAVWKRVSYWTAVIPDIPDIGQLTELLELCDALESSRAT